MVCEVGFEDEKKELTDEDKERIKNDKQIQFYID
jgi:hypothetical protein